MTERIRAVDRPAGVVFDMDGLLLDSERLARDLFFTACETLGCEVDPDLYHRCVGASGEATTRLLAGALGREQYQRLEALWSARYREAIHRHPVPVKAGAHALLKRLQALDVPLAVATSTRRQTATTKLRLAGLLGYFPVLVCGGETPRGKPDPEPYLAAVEALGAPAGDCWACEDSANGVRSAHAAGLRVFQVPDLVAPDAALRALRHRILTRLDDLLELLA